MSKNVCCRMVGPDVENNVYCIFLLTMYFLYVHGFFACTHLCTPDACLLPVEARRGSDPPNLEL